MHLSSRPPAADWMGKNSVCHGVTLPFPESSTWNRSLLFWGGRQGCLCESVKFLLTLGLPLTPVSLRSPSSSVCPVSSFRGSNVSVQQVWRCELYLTFYSASNQLVSAYVLLSCEFSFKHRQQITSWIPNNAMIQKLHIWLRDIVCYRRSDAWHTGSYWKQQETSKLSDRLNMNEVRKEHREHKVTTNLTSN